MITLRSLQLLSHVTIIGLTTANVASLVYHVIITYQTATPHVASLHASAGLSSVAAVLMCCPVFIGCVVGRLEYNRFNHSIKLSYLDLFGRRCEVVSLARQCTISRESKICKLPGTKVLPFLVFWKDPVEEIAENISILSAEGSRDQKKTQPDVGQGYQFKERVYILVVGSIGCISLLVLVKYLRDSGQIDEILSFTDMVNVTKGVLLTCDAAVKQFLVHIDETGAVGQRFIISDLDDTHLFIIADVLDYLQEKLDELMDSHSFTEPN
ncbi:hypothetical protein ACHWQZ_G016663 [Mnemiopsis leidyi]